MKTLNRVRKFKNWEVSVILTEKGTVLLVATDWNKTEILNLTENLTLEFSPVLPTSIVDYIKKHHTYLRLLKEKYAYLEKLNDLDLNDQRVYFVRKHIAFISHKLARIEKKA